MKSKKVFILASKSLRRKELLQDIGIKAEIIPSNVTELNPKGMTPESFVAQNAMLKALDVARSFRGETIVIGADTCVYHDGKILGKPKTIEEAENMLKGLSAKTHEVYTGYCVVNCKDGTSVSKYEKTYVTFREISESEIKAYVKTREPMDKAGAYGIQNRGSLFVEKIEGDYFNVVGLPVCALSKLLKEEFKIEIL